MGDINKAVQFMVDIANDNKHGYDQKHRNSPDYDCSSLVGTALHEAGFDVSPYSWTGNLKPQLLACGFETISVHSERKRGDIFLSENHHVVMCVDEDTIVHASINEKGTTTGGKRGDQTGKEICTRSFYTPSYGWDYHFRHRSEKVVTKSLTEIAKEVIKGCYGNGAFRRAKLERLGYDYEAVQDKVNDLLNSKSNLKPIGVIAREVINGKWGNGKARIEKLRAKGYDAEKVQNMVNKMLG